MWPVLLSPSNSSRFARPHQTFRVTDVPSNSTQCRGTSKPILRAGQVNVPAADLKIKVVLPARRIGSGLKRLISTNRGHSAPQFHPSSGYRSRSSSLPRSFPHPPKMLCSKWAEFAVISDMNKPHEDSAAIERFLVEKLATTILKFADGRRAQVTVASARIVETPLVRLGIVELQG